MDEGDFTRWLEMYVTFNSRGTRFFYMDTEHMATDIILAACDVEGNFLVVRVCASYGYLRLSLAKSFRIQSRPINTRICFRVCCWMRQSLSVTRNSH